MNCDRHSISIRELEILYFLGLDVEISLTFGRIHCKTTSGIINSNMVNIALMVQMFVQKSWNSKKSQFQCGAKSLFGLMMNGFPKGNNWTSSAFESFLADLLLARNFKLYFFSTVCRNNWISKKNTNFLSSKGSEIHSFLSRQIFQSNLSIEKYWTSKIHLVSEIQILRSDTQTIFFKKKLIR